MATPVDCATTGATGSRDALERRALMIEPARPVNASWDTPARVRKARSRCFSTECEAYCAAAMVAVTVRSAAQAEALFEFHSNPWLNLHMLGK